MARSNVQSISLADHDFGRALGGSLQHTGFAVVRDHRIPRELLDAAYAVMHELFHLGNETLLKYEDIDGGHQRGFTPHMTETAVGATHPDLKQLWMMGPDWLPHLGANVWPTEVPNFRPIMLELYRALDILWLRLLDELSEYLLLPSAELFNLVHRGNTIMRPLHYPALERPAKALGLRSAPHTDINLLTLLVAGTSPGLEVQNRDGDWLPVNEEYGSIVVNVGDMLELFTEGFLHSTMHRVVNDNEERFSIPFFGHPPPTAVLHKPTGYTAGEFLTYRLVEIKMLPGDLSKLKRPPKINRQW